MSERERRIGRLLQKLERHQAQFAREQAAVDREIDRLDGLAAEMERLEERIEEALTDEAPELAVDAGEEMCFPGFDGFVAGVALCPEAVPAAEWLAAVWEAEPELDRIVAGNAAARAETHAVLTERVEQVGRVLEEDPAAYEPSFGMDPDTGEVYWERWVLGFERAMRLRPEAWAAVALGEGDAAAAVSTMLSLYGVAADIGELADGLDETAIDLAPELISVAVVILGMWCGGSRTPDTGGWTAPWPDPGTARPH